jgi:hypothetical protein
MERRIPWFRGFTASAAVILAMALTPGCGGDSGGADTVVTSAQVTNGNGQDAVVGTELRLPLTARLLNAEGTAVAGQAVAFVVTGGGGSVFAPSSTSDSDGVVSDRWTLGTIAGAQAVELRWVDGQGNTRVLATFTASGLPAAPAAVSIVAGDGQTSPQGGALATALKVVSVDRYGNATPGVSVAFATTDGGTLAPAAIATDAAGTASSGWTLGGAAGTQHASATISGVMPVIFTATSTAVVIGPATQLLVEAGDQQTVAQHHVLAQPLVVTVVNSHGNGVAGVAVTFGAAPGSGYITSTTVTTDGSGNAAWQGYVNGSGTQQIEASANGVQPVVFSVSVTGSSLHAYDGAYVCPMTYTSGDASLGPSQLLLTFQNGLFVATQPDNTDATLDESTGQVVATWGQHGYRLSSADMLLVVDATADANGTGTFDVVVNGLGFQGPDGTVVASGTWSCQRQ